MTVEEQPVTRIAKYISNWHRMEDLEPKFEGFWLGQTLCFQGTWLDDFGWIIGFRETFTYVTPEYLEDEVMMQLNRLWRLREYPDEAFGVWRDDGMIFRAGRRLRR